MRCTHSSLRRAVLLTGASFLYSYAVDVDFKSLGITPEVVVNDAKRTEARKAIKKIFQEKYTQGKHKWFFSKLRF